MNTFDLPDFLAHRKPHKAYSLVLNQGEVYLIESGGPGYRYDTLKDLPGWAKLAFLGSGVSEKLRDGTHRLPALIDYLTPERLIPPNFPKPLSAASPVQLPTQAQAENMARQRSLSI